MIVIVFLLLLDLSPGLNFLICVILSLSTDRKSIKTALFLEESLVWVRGLKENNKDGRRQQQQSQVGRQQPLPRLQQERLPLGAGVWSRQEAMAQAVHPVLSHGLPVSITNMILMYCQA